MTYYEEKGIGSVITFFKNKFNLVSIFLLLVSVALYFYSLVNNLFTPYTRVFFLVGLNCAFDILIHIFIACLWGQPSMYELGVVKNKPILSGKSDGKVNLPELRKASWQPRWVGILERVIMTVSFINGRYDLVAGWLILKVVKFNDSRGEKKQKNSLWRITENIFLIGTALSIISSFAGANLYKNMQNINSFLIIYENRKTNYHIIPFKNRGPNKR